jgi:hypothetical protein
MAWQDALTHVRYEIEPGREEGALTHRLEAIRDGSPAASTKVAPLLLNSTALPGSTVSLTLDRGILTATLGNSPPLSLYLGKNAKGHCGILTPPPTTPSLSPPGYGKIRVSPLASNPPVTSINEVFDQEKLMKVWSGKAGEWRAKPGGSRYDQVYWHRAFFYHDTELEVALPTTTKDLTPESELALSLAKAAGSGEPHNGYVLQYHPGRQPKPTLTLVRSGTTVAEMALPSAHPATRLLFRRSGPHLVAAVDGEPVLHFTDPTPLQGPKLAWATRQYNIPVDAIETYNRNLLTYSFNSAPTDWRIGAGIWEVTNRWECDPRWSFWAGMPPRIAEKRASALEKVLSAESAWKAQSLRRQLSLLPDRKEPHTVLWHKQGFGGDLVIEFFMGQMMEYARGGTRYQNYVRDFNISFCADGNSLKSGYTFVYGGWGNRRSALLREDKVVDQVNRGIDLASAHRRWLRLRVEKSGNTITCTTYTTINPREPDKRVLDVLRFEDPNPLAGTRMAVWSYNCGILITRARVSADTVMTAESPFATPTPHVESIYTQ